ncbi:hypothetical protein [Novosphingobium sp.]|uniref:hypothetical protein n=1 Tax=Novosphingobium sp. TaxID=1874826 RepID=UPI00333ED051
MNAIRPTRPSIRALALPLLLGAAATMAGCSQNNADTVADLQQKLIAAEARATAAEKRVKDADAQTAMHNQEPPPNQDPQAPPPEIAENGEGNFGQPMNDTVPIEPAPAMPAANQP